MVEFIDFLFVLWIVIIILGGCAIGAADRKDRFRHDWMFKEGSWYRGRAPTDD